MFKLFSANKQIQMRKTCTILLYTVFFFNDIKLKML